MHGFSECTDDESDLPAVAGVQYSSLPIAPVMASGRAPVAWFSMALLPVAQPVADLVGRCLMAGNEQPDTQSDQFVLAQLVVGVAGEDKCAE